MNFFLWNDAFNTGIAAMDEQHRKFFGYVNELQELAGGTRGRDALRRLFGELLNYVERHFSAEEHLLSGNGYPDLSIQRKQHAFFCSQISELKARYESGTDRIPESTLQFLRDWFLAHILEEDKKYGKFLDGIKRGNAEEKVPS